MNRSLSFTIDFTDEWVEANVTLDGHDEVRNQLNELEHVDIVCIDHMCWVSFDVGNVHLQTLTEIADEMEAEIQRIIDEAPKDV